MLECAESGSPPWSRSCATEGDGRPCESVDHDEPGHLSGGGVGVVVREGSVPFAILDGDGVVMARFRVTLDSQPGWDDDESTDWTLTLDGHSFEVITRGEGEAWLPLSDKWAQHRKRPLRARRSGLRHVVSYRYYWAHHYGSMSGDVRLTFDLHDMTVEVTKNLEIDLD
jgi:hypothetical protein